MNPRPCEMRPRHPHPHFPGRWLNANSWTDTLSLMDHLDRYLCSLPTYLSIYLSFYLSIYLSINLSIYLSRYLISKDSHNRVDWCI